MTLYGELRDLVRQEITRRSDEAVALCQKLVQIDSRNPPGDTEQIAEFIEEWIGERPDVQVIRVCGKSPVLNLIVRMRCGNPGRRLLFNAHMDTFPVGDPSNWSVDPLGGVLEGGRIYGRGVSDMKAGLAVSLMAFDILYHVREKLAGELVLTLVGDEETGGEWGTRYVLDNAPEVYGDAMLNADAGSPEVVRFGEKGQLWATVRAVGRPAHGAHVHLGQNAIKRLIDAIQKIQTIEQSVCSVPDDIDQAISSASDVSERVSGRGESGILRRITMNVGTIRGGTAVNMVPEDAQAELDFRFPPGVCITDIQEKILSEIAPLDGVSVEFDTHFPPFWTSPREEIVQRTVVNTAEVMGSPAVANMRLGFSDARFFRERGIPSVVYGLTPYNMGGSNEYVTTEDLFTVFQVHVLTALDYLSTRTEGAT